MIWQYSQQAARRSRIKKEGTQMFLILGSCTGCCFGLAVFCRSCMWLASSFTCLLLFAIISLIMHFVTGSRRAACSRDIADYAKKRPSPMGSAFCVSRIASTTGERSAEVDR